MTAEKKPEAITRRDFVKGIAVGAVATAAVSAGVTAVSWPAPPPPVTKTETVTKTTTAPATTTTLTTTVPIKFPTAKGAVAYDPSLCAGCNVCVDTCSLYHFGECQPSLAALTLKTYPTDAWTTENETCHQCQAPSCMTACPVLGAMYVDEKTGARCVDQKKCTGCGLCARACPFNAEGKVIKYNPATKTYFKCDLCGGEPQCVRLCSMGALSFKEAT